MKKNVMIITSVASMVDQFMIPNIDLLLEMGYQIHLACNFKIGNTTTDEKIIELKRKLDEKDVKYYQIDFDRDIMNLKNHVKSYQQINEIFKKYRFDFIHCHSPIGGVIGRLIGRRNKVKVVYTAHGFHFFKGAPLKNWLIFYPIEKLLSYLTDVLIVINKEDYQRALKNFKAKKVAYLPGIGIDLSRFEKNETLNREEVRKKINVPKDAFMLISIGELNRNKNHSTVVKAIEKLKNPNIHYVICGQGKLEEYLRQLVSELNLENQVHLLGFRTDIVELCSSADVFLFPSFREGLGMGALEGMASGLPLITSNVHGIVDYSIDNITGLTCNPSESAEFAEAIKSLYNNKELLWEMAHVNLEYVKKFDVNNVISLLRKIYNEDL